MALWCVIENLVLLGGSRVGVLKTLIKHVEELEKEDKYHLWGADFPGKARILDLLQTIDKAGAEDVDNVVLRPLREVDVDPNETEEQFKQRMMYSTIVSGELNDKSDWMKVYTRYMKAKNEGNLEELQLEVS